MNGILVVNKPYGYTSRDVVNIISKKLGTKKETIICIIKIINSKSKQKIEAYFRTNNITRKTKRKNSDYGFSR